MDNLTHSLVGWALADAVLAGLKRRRWDISPTVAGVFRAVSIGAANAPDVDLVYSGIDHSRLGYMLHHRGYTHTVLALLLLWLLGAALFAWAQRQGRVTMRPWQWGILGILAALSLASHLIMDYGNNYGLHPFWPLDDHWYYGDSLFIIEPWLWVILAFGLYRTEAPRWTKAFLGLVALATVSLPWLSSMATLTTAILLTVGVLIASVLCWRWPQRPRLLVALALFGLFLGLTKGLSVGIKEAVRRELRQSVPTWRIEDVILTPRPANPLCWSLMTAATDQEGQAKLIGGSFSLLTRADNRSTCQALADHPASMPASPPSLVAQNPQISWDWEFAGNVGVLQEWAKRSTAVRAFGQFARAPFWDLQGGTLYLGDARFDRSVGQDFSEISVNESSLNEGSLVTAPWLPPRASLFPSP